MNSTYRARRWIWFMWTSVIKFLAAERILGRKKISNLPHNEHEHTHHVHTMCISLNCGGEIRNTALFLRCKREDIFQCACRFLLMCARIYIGALLAWRNVRPAVLAFLQRPWRLGDWLIDWLALSFHKRRLLCENFANGILSAWCISVASQLRRWRMTILFTQFSTTDRISTSCECMQHVFDSCKYMSFYFCKICTILAARRNFQLYLTNLCTIKSVSGSQSFQISTTASKGN